MACRSYILIVVLSCSIGGCKERLSYWQVYYPPELEYQIELFKEYAPKHVKARKLTFVLTGHGLRTSDGQLCAGLSKPKDQTIYLDTTSSHWMNAKTALVLHELGHYVLDRKHNNSYIDYPSKPELRIPTSVMHIKAEIKEEYIVEDLELQNYYLTELFYGN